MAKQSTCIHANVTTVPESLEERLNRHPKLKAKIQALLSVVENAEGDLLKANEAEQRVVEEIRQRRTNRITRMGRTAESGTE